MCFYWTRWLHKIGHIYNFNQSYFIFLSGCVRDQGVIFRNTETTFTVFGESCNVLVYVRLGMHNFRSQSGYVFSHPGEKDKFRARARPVILKYHESQAVDLHCTHADHADTPEASDHIFFKGWRNPSSLQVPQANVRRVSAFLGKELPGRQHLHQFRQCADVL